MADDTRSVVVATIVKAHGIRGGVIVRPETDRPAERLAPGAVFGIEDRIESFRVVSASPHGAGYLLRFEGVVDRSEAEALRGLSLTIRPDERRALDVDEFWPDELTGCRVFGVGGAEIGRVIGLEMGEAQHRLVVQIEHGGVGVLPFVADLVPEIDVSERKVVVDPPEGWDGSQV